MINEKRAPGCLGYIGDELLPSYVGFHKPLYMFGSALNNQDFRWKVSGRFFWPWLNWSICILSDGVLRRSESIFWGFFWIPRCKICVGWGRVGDHQPFLKHMSPSSIQSSTKRRIARTNQDMKESRSACKDWSISTVSEGKKKINITPTTHLPGGTL